MKINLTSQCTMDRHWPISIHSYMAAADTLLPLYHTSIGGSGTSDAAFFTTIDTRIASIPVEPTAGALSAKLNTSGRLRYEDALRLFTTCRGTLCPAYDAVAMASDDDAVEADGDKGGVRVLRLRRSILANFLCRLLDGDAPLSSSYSEFTQLRSSGSVPSPLVPQIPPQGEAVLTLGEEAVMEPGDVVIRPRR